MVSRCVCQSAPVRALVVPVCCERGLYFKKSSLHKTVNPQGLQGSHLNLSQTSA